MNFTVKFRPTTVTKHWSYKPIVNDLLNGPVMYTFSSWGQGYTRNNGEMIYGIVYHKFRKKTKQTKLPNGKTKSVVIRKGGWNVSIYTFTRAQLEVLGIKIIQKTRHFEVVKVK